MSSLGTFLVVLNSVFPYAEYKEPLSESQLNVLREALTSPYRGCAPDAFYEYLAENNAAFDVGRVRRYHGKFCSIVQSSGTGKTRLMLEAGFHRCESNNRVDTPPRSFAKRMSVYHT